MQWLYQSHSRLIGPGHSLENFTEYITFVGADVTYLPSDPNYVGTDTFSFFAQQEDAVTSNFLTINIEVLPSWCLNNGVCSGSINDPDCSNITNRKASPGEYNCSCVGGYSGSYCQYSNIEVVKEQEPGENHYLCLLYSHTLYNVIYS